MDNSNLNSNLNLARKWRSKNFDQIIGQDLCVRILKNGLYLNTFFPVYLFSGQRGCGKTSTARVFAAAVNCQKLEDFQKDAKILLPCLECVSCISISQNKHPDFIEIDAASHTGVDNIRNIIEASSFLPLIGRKKIYLIDEAHMLSKAAFNAFLKILEEPPASVLFILATTDVQKIIDTVRSRSFQLFFTNINQDILIEHLQYICKQEAINYDINALNIIARESQGSVRDAINILEQVRFSAQIINKENTLNILGQLSDENLLLFLDYLLNNKNLEQFLNFLDKINYNNFSAEFIWNRLLELLRISIYLKNSVNLKSIINIDQINSIIFNTNISSIILVLNEFCKTELLFSKAVNKSLFLELLCLKIITSNLTQVPNCQQVASTKSVPAQEKKEIVSNLKDREIDQDWEKFINEIKKLSEPLIESVFTQSNFVEYNKSNQEIIIAFSKKSAFFKELLDDKINLWLPILKKTFDSNISLKINFDENINNSVENKTITVKKDIVPKQINKEVLDISDQQKWQLTNALINQFPGKIIEIEEDHHE